MAEYIDKQAAIQELEKARLFLLDRRMYGAEHILVRHAIPVIEAIPPAYVQPVRRGRWKKVGGFVTPGGDPVWQCSECKKGRHVYGIEHGTYGASVSDGQWVSCPNCGADMRGEQSG